MTVLLVISMCIVLSAAVDVCKSWPNIGSNKFRVDVPLLTAWRRFADILQEGATDRKDATTFMQKQCVSYNSDIDWLSADESTRYAATDVKLTVCGDEIHVRDCNDLSGKLLFVIQSDVCFEAREFRVMRCGDGAQQDAEECMKNGRFDFLFTPINPLLTLRHYEYNVSISYLGKTPVVYAVTTMDKVFTRSVDVTIFPNASTLLTAEQRNEANGLIALLLSTRLFNKFEGNDTCSNFYTYGIPVLVLIGVFCLVLIGLAVRNRMSRA
jgi:hypothetical protein